MPAQDRTGPSGEGPLTGRGLGPCGRDQGMRRGFRKGFGRGPRRGFGFRQCYTYPEEITLTKEEQKKILEEELKYIEEDKKQIEKKLKELK